MQITLNNSQTQVSLSIGKRTWQVSAGYPSNYIVDLFCEKLEKSGYKIFRDRKISIESGVKRAVQSLLDAQKERDDRYQQLSDDYPNAIVKRPIVHSEGVDYKERKATSLDIENALRAGAKPGVWKVLQSFEVGLSAGMSVSVRL